MNELRELADSVRTVVNSAGLAAPEAEAWTHASELGWLQAGVPEELGGLGLGLPALCAIQQELGRGLMGVPYAAATLAINAISQSGLKDRAARIEKLVGGDFVTMPLVPASVKLKAGRLTGSASAVPSADRAGHVILCGPAVVALLPLKGIKVKPRPTWDATQQLFDIALPAKGVKPELVLATGAAAKSLGRRLAAQLDFMLAADSVGGAASLLEATVDYLQTRKQFGRPLALFQALKHRCADLKAKVSAAEALLFASLARQAEADEAQAVVQAMGAKQFACTVYSQVAEEAIQLHGGIGMTAEHPCHLFFKRAQLNEHLGWHRDYDIGIADGFFNKE
jgi:alkylation response protein AidB-like acyl-CoA dehydrogenase